MFIIHREALTFKICEYKWTNEFFKELKSKRKVALRMGRLSENSLHYNRCSLLCCNMARGLFLMFWDNKKKSRAYLDSFPPAVSKTDESAKNNIQDLFTSITIYTL